ncbi:hypothetical protein ACVWZL_001304 [Bradyrhizobium sp. GM2.4]
MTPDQRAKHEAWHRTHRPGAGAARSAERERARQSADARRLIAEQPPEVLLGPEAVRIREALAAAKAELARLEVRSEVKSDNSEVFE